MSKLHKNGDNGTRATILDVARFAGVSSGTVSNALNRPTKVASAKRAIIDDAIGQLGYVRNDAARQLRAGRSRTLGLVIPDFNNPFFTEVARGAENYAATVGLSLVVGSSDQIVERERRYLELFTEQRTRGILLCPVGDFDGSIPVKANGPTIVLVDGKSTGVPISSVAVDHILGGELAVSHLIALGRTRIALVGGGKSAAPVRDRERGARRAVRHHPEIKVEVVKTRGLTSADGRAAGEEILRRSVDNRPDGVFAMNDLVAIGVLHALHGDRSVAIPEDIAIVGYDDISFTETAVIPLTSVRQPGFVIGQTAAEILTRTPPDSEHEAQLIVFAPELIVRATTAKWQQR